MHIATAVQPARILKEREHSDALQHAMADEAAVEICAREGSGAYESFTAARNRSRLSTAQA